MLFSNAAKCSLLCFLTFPIIPCYALNKTYTVALNDDSIYVVLHGEFLLLVKSYLKGKTPSRQLLMKG